jgi:hypothetical protein
MECPFHAGSEAITTCVQCETPICPLCSSETNQIHLCLNCYRARVEELSAGLGSASVRLAKERPKGEVKKQASRKKKKGEAPPAPVAKAAFAVDAAESLWDKEEMAPVAPGEMAPPAEAAPAIPETMPVAGLAAPVVMEEPPSKKELARMQKEEAKRLKEEEKAAKKARKAEPEMAAAPIPVPEPAPFFEPTPEPPAYTPPPEAAPSFEAALPFETAPPPAEPPPLTEMPPPGYPTEPPSGGIRLPSLDERLEPLPPREDSGGLGFPPGMEPPEGFFE